MWTRVLGMISLTWVFLTVLHLRLESIALLESLSPKSFSGWVAKGWAAVSGGFGVCAAVSFFRSPGSQGLSRPRSFLGLVLVTDTSPSQPILKLASGLRKIGGWALRILKRPRRKQQSAPAPRPKPAPAEIEHAEDEKPDPPQPAPRKGGI